LSLASQVVTSPARSAASASMRRASIPEATTTGSVRPHLNWARKGVWESKAFAPPEGPAESRGSLAVTKSRPFPPSRFPTTYRRALVLSDQFWLSLVLSEWVTSYSKPVATVATAAAASANLPWLRRARPFTTEASPVTSAPPAPAVNWSAESAS